MTSLRGKSAELCFGSIAMEMRWDVALPLAEDSVFDLLINRGEGWETVQVKRVYQKNGHPTVNLVRANGERYRRGDADWLAAVDVDTKSAWLIPFDKVYRYQRKRLTEDLDQYLLEWS